MRVRSRGLLTNKTSFFYERKEFFDGQISQSLRHLTWADMSWALIVVHKPESWAAHFTFTKVLNCQKYFLGLHAVARRHRHKLHLNYAWTTPIVPIPGNLYTLLRSRISIANSVRARIKARARKDTSTSEESADRTSNTEGSIKTHPFKDPL